MSEGTLEPTPKRLEKARREGDLGASGAPAAALVLLAAILALPALAAAIAAAARTELLATLELAGAATPDTSGFDAKTTVTAVLLLAAPIGAVAATLAIASTFLETRFGLSLEKLAGTRAEGGSRPFVAPFVGALGAGALGLLATAVLLVVSARDVAHAGFGRVADMPVRATKVTTGPLRFLAGLAVVSAFGSTYAAMRARNARLRMTHREVEEERKAGDGDPETKAARRRIAETVFSEVPLRGLPRATSACVVGHALVLVVSWNADVDPAPRLLRKLLGTGADRLVTEAREVGLAVVHDAEIAKEIAKGTAVGALVGEALYDPIATLFARASAAS